MNYTLLNQINSPQDLKRLPDSQLNQLCKEIRSFLVESVSKTGGHLASNLGVVELTVALHRVFDCPEDKIIWDVGHQSYVHKLLTGRKDMFDTLRKENGIAGFPRRCLRYCQGEHPTGERPPRNRRDRRWSPDRRSRL